jgi:hypothetical protein
MRTAVSGKKNFRGTIVPELNDAQTSLCILGAILVANPHVFNWSATLWLAVISPVAFPPLFQFLMWGTESRPSLRRKYDVSMEETIAIIDACINEIHESDSAQCETPKEIIPKLPLTTPTFVLLLPTRTNVSPTIAHSLHNRGSNRRKARKKPCGESLSN